MDESDDVDGDDEDDEAPGWVAIDGALAEIYGDTEPLHLATLVKWRLGGPDPLDGISAYPRTDPTPHWHFVSYGMTELYAKESDNADESGWGFELTFRVARDPADEQPPGWAASVLQNLGRYVFTTGNWFGPGHHMNLNGPIAVERDDSAIRAISFVEDPELGSIDTLHGKVQFLQVVGLTLDELEACQKWNAESLLALLAPSLPLFVTDIDRPSLLDDPQLAEAVRAGVDADGSSVGWLDLTTAEWEQDTSAGTVTVRVGALQAPVIADMLRARLPHGRPLVLRADGTTIIFEPADSWESQELEPGVLKLGIPAATLDDLAATLQPQASRTPVASLPGLTVEIVPTVMKDEHGNETGEVVG